MIKNTIIVTILLFASLFAFGQDTLKTPQFDDNEIVKCKLLNIVYDTTHLDISEIVDIRMLNEAFGERDTYNIKFYVWSELNYEEGEFSIAIKNILLKGTSFIDLNIKEQFVKQLEEYIKSLNNEIDQNKVNDCKEFIYHSTVRLCR